VPAERRNHEPKSDRYEFARRAHGRSDIILLSKENKVLAGAVVHIVWTAREKRRALVRQALPDQGDQIVVQPWNKEHALEFLTHADVDAIYRMVGRVGMFDPAPSEIRT